MVLTKDNEDRIEGDRKRLVNAAKKFGERNNGGLDFEILNYAVGDDPFPAGLFLFYNKDLGTVSVEYIWRGLEDRYNWSHEGEAKVSSFREVCIAQSIFDSMLHRLDIK